MSEEKERIALRLDLTGKQCYQIRLELRVQISTVEVGDIIQVITDNPNSPKTLPKWCALNDQELFLSDTRNGQNIFFIRRLV